MIKLHHRRRVRPKDVLWGKRGLGQGQKEKDRRGVQSWSIISGTFFVYQIAEHFKDHDKRPREKIERCGESGYP